ncbi:MAG: hypothetical protein SFX18_04140 [Pirellulales bacterium]|nr:hypothetical protein [Pirellulales bacterium]
MGRSSTVSPVDHFARFYKLAQLIENGASMRSAATNFGYSSSANPLRESISALEKSLGPLIEEYSNGKYRLTINGKKLFNKIKQLVETPAITHIVNLYLSQSLLTLDILSPAIRKIIDNTSPDIAVNIQCRQQLDFYDIIRQIHNDEIGIAICWSHEEREANFPSISRHELATNIPMLLISHSESYLDSCIQNGALNFTTLATRRFCVMDRDSQPFMKLLPLPDYSNNGSRIIVDSLESLIANVRAHAADYAIIPAICGDLVRYRQQGALYFAPISRKVLPGIGISAYMKCSVRSFLNSTYDRMLKDIKDQICHVRKITNCPTTEIEMDENTLSDRENDAGNPSFTQISPTNVKWYQSMNYGYYLDFKRDVSNSTVNWKEERIKLNIPKKLSQVDTFVDDNAKIRFKGQIINVYRDTFAIRRAELIGNVFCVNARKVNREASSSVDSFVSVFTLYHHDEGLMYGIWNGVDADNQPCAYATIWSHSKLTSNRIYELARAISFNLVLNSQNFIEHL